MMAAWHSMWSTSLRGIDFHGLLDMRQHRLTELLFPLAEIVPARRARHRGAAALWGRTFAEIAGAVCARVHLNFFIVVAALRTQFALLLCNEMGLQ